MHQIVIAVAQYAVVIPVLVLAAMVWWLQRQRLELVVFLVLSVLIALVLAKIAAALHQDPRPFVRDGVTPYFAHGPDDGFPSDHATYSAVIAFVIMRYRRKLGAVLIVLALLIGSARVVAGVHHGQDIIAGLIIAAIATAAALILTKGLQRHFPRLRPAAVRPESGKTLPDK